MLQGSPVDARRLPRRYRVVLLPYRYRTDTVPVPSRYHMVLLPFRYRYHAVLIPYRRFWHRRSYPASAARTGTACSCCRTVPFRTVAMMH